MDIDDEKLTERQAAKWLGYAKITLYQWRNGHGHTLPKQNRKLPYIKVGCHAYYSMKDLKNFVLREE